jgi:hypothetical protein
MGGVHMTERTPDERIRHLDEGTDAEGRYK